MITIEGDAAFDSHDYVSNLKPRYDNENTNSDASGNSDLRIDSDSAVSQLEGVRRDQARDGTESADDIG